MFLYCPNAHFKSLVSRLCLSYWGSGTRYNEARVTRPPVRPLVRQRQESRRLREAIEGVQPELEEPGPGS